MGFILVPNHGEDLVVNSWNWRPTLEFIRSQGLVTEENYERMGIQLGTQVDADTSVRIAAAVEARLAGMHAGERILADLTITNRPKKNWVITPDTKSGDIDANDVYSASYEWLVEFCAFCRSSGGFEVS